MTRFGRMESPSYSILGRGRPAKKGENVDSAPAVSDPLSFNFFNTRDVFLAHNQTKRVILEMFFPNETYLKFSYFG